MIKIELPYYTILRPSCSFNNTKLHVVSTFTEPKVNIEIINESVVNVRTASKILIDEGIIDSVQKYFRKILSFNLRFRNEVFASKFIEIRKQRVPLLMHGGTALILEENKKVYVLASNVGTEGFQYLILLHNLLYLRNLSKILRRYCFKLMLLKLSAITHPIEDLNKSLRNLYVNALSKLLTRYKGDSFLKDLIEVINSSDTVIPLLIDEKELVFQVSPNDLTKFKLNVEKVYNENDVNSEIYVAKINNIGLKIEINCDR